MKDALIRSRYGDQGLTTNSSQWSELQQQIRNNDLTFSRPDYTVRVGRIYFREFPEPNGKPVGKISEAWVCLDYTGIEFLYKKDRKYGQWENIIAPFMLNRGDGKYHSIKGLGVRMYALLLHRERLENAKTDAAFTMASLHLRNTGNDKMTPSSLIQMGPYTLWKSGFEPIDRDWETATHTCGHQAL